MFVDGNSIEGQNKPLATRLWAQILLSLPILFMPSFSLAQAPLKWTSGSHHVALLEVYSSQGCSSCPPAQKWVNQFTESDLLWDQVIPMVFHVNYWDYIGWKDPFATEYFSQRQRALKSNNLIQSVYTPGFVVDGKEWKGWFQGRPVPRASPSAKNSASVTAELTQQGVTVDYRQTNASNNRPAYLNIAVLAFDLKTSVGAGENAHKILTDNFVVVGFEQHTFSAESKRFSYPKTKVTANQYALVIWLTTENRLTPISAVGGYIPPHWQL